MNAWGWGVGSGRNVSALNHDKASRVPPPAAISLETARQSGWPTKVRRHCYGCGQSIDSRSNRRVV
ncbi:MAG: hypothetical protein GPOALKHO_000915 [Sodalis sp.]|nr:MAG: hypothetical protein GPOALKHO_000915 [Sodalis sp.]